MRRSFAVASFGRFLGVFVRRQTSYHQEFARRPGLQVW